jgi:hypothetical protein
MWSEPGKEFKRKRGKRSSFGAQVKPHASFYFETDFK